MGILLIEINAHINNQLFEKRQAILCFVCFALRSHRTNRMKTCTTHLIASESERNRMVGKKVVKLNSKTLILWLIIISHWEKDVCARAPQIEREFERKPKSENSKWPKVSDSHIYTCISSRYSLSVLSSWPSEQWTHFKNSKRKNKYLNDRNEMFYMCFCLFALPLSRFRGLYNASERARSLELRK